MAGGTWWRSARAAKVVTIVAGVVIALVVIGLVNRTGEQPNTVTSANDSTVPTVSDAVSTTAASEPPDTPTQPAPALAAYPVLAVVDGDTLHVDIDGQDRTIRVIGIDAPETFECWGGDASNAATALLGGASVQLVADPTQADTDRYGRLLRYVLLPDGSDFGSTMISAGNAYEYTYDVPYENQATYRTLQSAAAANARGAWGTGTCRGRRTPNDASTAVTQQDEPATPTTGSGSCDIKGNINGKGEKIYHEPGDRDYDRTKIDESNGERWFCSAADARAAGWRAADN